MGEGRKKHRRLDFRHGSLPTLLPLNCLPACLPACPPACLPACLPVCLPACLPACLLACLPACFPACPPVRLSHVFDDANFRTIPGHCKQFSTSCARMALSVIMYPKCVNEYFMESNYRYIFGT
jgi:hypothetical protein